MNESDDLIQASAGRTGTGARDWVVALIAAALLFLIAYAGFVLVPDRMVNHWFEGLVPRTRDALVLLWVVIFFGFMCWLFVRVQRPWGKVGRAVRR